MNLIRYERVIVLIVLTVLICTLILVRTYAITEISHCVFKYNFCFC